MLRKLKLVLNQQNSNNIIGNGITKGTNEVNTVIVNSSAKTFRIIGSLVKLVS
jgi:hypothetical protein